MKEVERERTEEYMRMEDFAASSGFTAAQTDAYAR
jgi:hypothetical protein